MNMDVANGCTQNIPPPEEVQWRRGVYSLLAAVFSREPSKEMIEALRGRGTGGLFDQMDDGGAENDGESVAFQALLAKPDESLCASLASEYCALFIGPGKHIPPYSSMYMEEQPTLWGKSTRFVNQFFRMTGFTPPEDRANPPDHISNELEFLAYLSNAEQNSLAQGDLRGAQSFRALQDKFFVKHFSRWAPKFFRCVRDHAPGIYYKFFAELALLSVENPESL